MLAVPSPSTSNPCEAQSTRSNRDNEADHRQKDFSKLQVTINNEPALKEEQNPMGTMRVIQGPPLICEQGPSTPSSPTISPVTSHFTRPRIPNLIISDSFDRFNLLTPEYGSGIDYNKLSPFRTYSTSDLGSSPQSSFSTTPNSLTNPWSAFRDYRKSNPESDTDSDVFSKDLLSPSAAFSPSPLSPLSDCSEPPDTPQSLSAFLGNFSSVSPHLPLKSLHFSFDDATSVEDDMDWSDLPETSTEVQRPSHRVPNFAIETVLSFPEQVAQAERLKEQQRSGVDSPSLQIDESFTDEAVLQMDSNTAKDEYVEKQLAEWKSRFNEQNRLEGANLGPFMEVHENYPSVFRFHDWNGLERIGGPLMASSLWHKSRSTPNIATRSFPCTNCSQVFEKQEDLQRHITLQHPDVCKMSINVRKCLLCQEFFEDNEALKLHVVIKHPDRTDTQSSTFRCQQCRLSFDSQLSFEEQVMKNHQPQRVIAVSPSDTRCAHCGRTIGQKTGLGEKVSSQNLLETSGQPAPTLFRKDAERLLGNCEVIEALDGNVSKKHRNLTEAVKEEQLKESGTNRQDEHYPCPQCPQVFEAKGGLRDHLFTHHMTFEERQKYHQQEMLKQREIVMGSKLDKNVYHCITCNQVFPSQERCNVHIAMEHPMQPLLAEEPKKCSCAICKQTTQVNNALKSQRSFKRIKEEVVYDGFRCSECGKLFPSRNHVEEHEAVVHQGPSASTVPFGKFVCQFCKEGFSNQDRLTKHIASRHRNPIEEAQKAHKCGVCGKGFARTDMLSRHMRLHKGDKPFSCTVCGQEFSRSDHLTTHMRTHSGEKPYRCPFCCYAASRRDMMNRHLKTHSKSPEHIKAQEARMNIEIRSASSSPNPATAAAVLPQFSGGNAVPNPVPSTLLNRVLPAGPVIFHNRFLIPQAVPQFPAYFSTELIGNARTPKSINCPQVVVPNQNCFLTPSASEPALSQQRIGVQHLLGPLAQVPLPLQRNEVGLTYLSTSSQQSIASAVDANETPGEAGSLSSVQLASMTQASVPKINLLKAPVKTEVTFECSS